MIKTHLLKSVNWRRVRLLVLFCYENGANVCVVCMCCMYVCVCMVQCRDEPLFLGVCSSYF